MPSEEPSAGVTHGAVAEWPRTRLERHKEMLEKKQAEIQGRIDAIEMILEDREP